MGRFGEEFPPMASLTEGRGLPLQQTSNQDQAGQRARHSHVTSRDRRFCVPGRAVEVAASCGKEEIWVFLEESREKWYRLSNNFTRKRDLGWKLRLSGDKIKKKEEKHCCVVAIL
ncbi:hypothetical protein RRG08_014050 [Elysia crispata]|uniref:Uncharacterized protein n=1 Tax=Elysia crispata TaxID=231223 RepID=A0AAE1DQW8_9GAST|nr:hypothetical protein RRG08_014050 [Elysia crispata]